MGNTVTYTPTNNVVRYEYGIIRSLPPLKVKYEYTIFVHNKALEHMEKGEYDSMIACYQDGIRKENCCEMMMNLAYYYQHIKKDYNTMMKYYEKAIKLNFVPAMNDIAVFYEKCNDTNNMMSYYNLAIKNGDKYAPYNMGLYYESNNDIGQMLDIMEIASERNLVIAQIKLGEYYEKNGSYTVAYKHYKRLADSGYNLGAYSIATYFKNRKEYKEMKKWYHIAIEQKTDNCHKALNDYGVYLINKKKPHHIIKALEYFEIASIEYKYTPSIENLIKYYREQEHNPDKMFEWILYGAKYSKRSDKFIERLNECLTNSNNYKNLFKAKKFLNKENSRVLYEYINKNMHIVEMFQNCDLTIFDADSG